MSAKVMNVSEQEQKCQARCCALLELMQICVMNKTLLHKYTQALHEEMDRFAKLKFGAEAARSIALINSGTYDEVSTDAKEILCKEVEKLMQRRVDMIKEVFTTDIESFITLPDTVMAQTKPFAKQEIKTQEVDVNAEPKKKERKQRH